MDNRVLQVSHIAQHAREIMQAMICGGCTDYNTMPEKAIELAKEFQAACLLGGHIQKMSGAKEEV